MSQGTLIVSAIVVLFLLFVTARGQLGNYIRLLA